MGRLAPEPSLNKPPTEAQYALEAIQPQDPATLNHAQGALAAAEAAAEDPVFVKTRMRVGTVRISSNMLAPTTGTPPGLFPTARSCVDNAAAVEVTAMGISLTQGAPRRTTPTGLFARGRRGRPRRTAETPRRNTTARHAGR